MSSALSTVNQSPSHLPSLSAGTLRLRSAHTPVHNMPVVQVVQDDEQWHDDLTHHELLVERAATSDEPLEQVALGQQNKHLHWLSEATPRWQ